MAELRSVGKHTLSNALHRDPRVGGGEHGWWQARPELGASSSDAFGLLSANLGLLVGSKAVDPVSRSASHRSLCAKSDEPLPPEAPT
jgi:hypothetical protein